VRQKFQTIKGKLNPHKKGRKVFWQWAKWPIEPPKDPAPSNFSNVAMVWISNSTNVRKHMEMETLYETNNQGTKHNTMRA
jgi:hypothetical protein